MHAEWKAKHNPGKYDIRTFLTSLSREQLALHAHSTETIAHDLYETIKPSPSSTLWRTMCICLSSIHPLCRSLSS